jgi:site-specific DNA recombinase
MTDSREDNIDKTKVAGYARVSTQAQAIEGTSPEEQKRVITEESARKGLELVHFYTDYGVSGKNSDRPGLKQLIQDAKDKKFGIVMFTKLDRLGRNLRDINNIYYELNEQNGIEIISIEQPEVNTKGLYGKLLISLLGAFAEFEHSMIRERTQNGRMAAWQDNKSMMGSLPLGYRLDKEKKQIVTDNDQAAIYESMVSMYLDERLSMMDLANKLNQRGVKSPGRYGNKWNHVTVSKILKNEAYMGKKVYNKVNFELRTTKSSNNQYYARTKIQKKEEQWISKKFPSLITEDRFNQVQTLMQSKVKRPKRKYKGMEGHFLLDNNLVYCGECGAKLQRQHNPNGAYNYYCYWRLASTKELKMRNRNKCILKTDADDLDHFVTNEIIELLSNPRDFAKNWLQDVNIDEIEEKVKRFQALTEEEAKVIERLDERLGRSEEANRIILDRLITEHEKMYTGYIQELSKAQREYENAHAKHTDFDEFEKLFSDDSSKREKMCTETQYRMRIEEFVRSLSFSERKKLVEAVISPETGGKIMVRYHRPLQEGDIEIDMENISEEELEKLDGPQQDEPPIVECQFNADLNKIGNFIAGLRRGGLLFKVIPRRIP